jgi:hypothetical protein
LTSEDQLKTLVAALRAWTRDPSNVNWRPVQRIMDELKEPGENKVVGQLPAPLNSAEAEHIGCRDDAGTADE